MSEQLQNWAKNLDYGAARIHFPASVTEVQEIVGRSEQVKALGTRHCFNDIADTRGDLVSTERLNRVISLDREKNTVTVEAGIRYGELCRHLDSSGVALHNMASLPHISVAGACVTATHGSGVALGNLSTSVSGLQFVSADGTLIALCREANPEIFDGAVVNLGGLGIITEVTLDLVPAFTMTQHVYDMLPFEALEKHFDDIMSCGYSVSLFTHWTSSFVDQVWVKRRVGDPISTDPSEFGAIPATEKRSPLPNGAVENCTEQLGLPGPWYDRLPHFRFGFTPSSGEELQTEYFVPRERAWEALKLIDEMRDQVAPLLLTTEVRSIASDPYWMSPCYGRSCVAIHFTWQKNWVKVQELLPTIESRLAPLARRPHWGKLFTLSPATLQAGYPKLPEFKALLAKYDPDGKFRNSFLKRNLY